MLMNAARLLVVASVIFLGCGDGGKNSYYSYCCFHVERIPCNFTIQPAAPRQRA